MAKGPKAVLITDTTFRDAHQSLLATRMKTEHMIPIAEKHDEIGFHSMEMWGGATFDTCMRFCGDDPWERLRVIRRHLKNQDPDAAERTEHCRLQELRRRCTN